MKWHFLYLLIIAIFLSAGSASADGGTLFRQKCGACHKIQGEAAPVNPADKAGVVWVRYFQRGRHKIDFSGTINNMELESIISYLQEFAADSDKPETAAIPK